MSLNKSMKVFIVDDYTTMLRIMRNLLRQLEIQSGRGSHRRRHRVAS